MTKLRLVRNLMEGIHVAAVIEVMSLSEKAGLDIDTLFEIIKGAAGSSRTDN